MGKPFFNLFYKDNLAKAENEEDGILRYAQKFVDLDLVPLDVERIPQHIAIVMDGNGRWAKERGLPRVMGHRQGVIAIEAIVEACSQLGVKYLTIYAFSTENWKRPQEEVSALMKLLVEFAQSKLERLCENNVRVQVLGDMEQLAPTPQKALDRLIKKTQNNTGLVLNMAINYGGRWEIIRAIQNLAVDVQQGKLQPRTIDETTFQRYLTTSDQPDPDLLIRTSGEERLSNFLLWQLAYAELYFTDVYWPDFKEVDLIQAISDFQKRSRRFGGVNDSKTSR